MEKELEVLEEGVSNELGNANHKRSKLMTVGIAAAAIGLYVAFRKKIKARAEKRMIKKLTKRGYTVTEPILDKDFDELLEPIE